MLQKLPSNTIISLNQNVQPSNDVLRFLLNYSAAHEAPKKRKTKFLICKN